MATLRTDGWYVTHARIAPGKAGRKACLGRTAAEADDKARALEAASKEIDSPPPPPSCPSGSVAEFVYGVYVPHVYPRLRKTSRRSYDSQLTNHLLPAIGHLPIGSIGYDELTTMVKGLRRVDGKGPLGRRAFEVEMRAKEILDLYATLTTARGEVARTDWKVVRPPTLARKKKRREPPADFTARIMSECHGRFAWAKGPVFAALFLGLRRGEIAGLMWSDIDREAMTISVSEQRQPEEKDGRVPTKGDERAIPIPPALLSWLDRLGSKESVFVFLGARGTPIPVNELSKVMPRLCERAGLPKIGLHDNRSIAASNLYDLGLDGLLIMEILGHHDFETTKLYLNGKDARKRKALESMLDQWTA